MAKRKQLHPASLRTVTMESIGPDHYIERPSMSKRQMARNAVLGTLGTGLIALVGVKYGSTIVEKVTPPTTTEVSKSYKKDLGTASVSIAQRAVEFSKRPNGTFKSQEDDFGPNTITISAASSAPLDETSVTVQMGRTDGRPDPDKVRSISMMQPQGKSGRLKVVSITAPSDSDTGAWDGSVGLYENYSDYIEDKPVQFTSTLPPEVGADQAWGGSTSNHYDFNGTASEIAATADNMFTQVGKDLQS